VQACKKRKPNSEAAFESFFSFFFCEKRGCKILKPSFNTAEEVFSQNGEPFIKFITNSLPRETKLISKLKIILA